MHRNPRAGKLMITLAGGALIGLAASAATPVYASMQHNPCARKMSKMASHRPCKNPCAAKKTGKMGVAEKNPCRAKRMDKKKATKDQDSSSSGM